MREIKFRAWNKKTREMIPMTHMYLCHEYSGFIWTPPSDHEYGGISSLPDRYRGDGENVAHTNYILMQYTGLKDRDGVEIVIGDILLLDLLSGDRYSSVRLCPVREIPTVCFFEEDDFEPLFCYVGKPDTCLRVVGNIYENPELLHNERAV